jgi:hypothetical protein
MPFRFDCNEHPRGRLIPALNEAAKNFTSQTQFRTNQYTKGINLHVRAAYSSNAMP